MADSATVRFETADTHTLVHAPHRRPWVFETSRVSGYGNLKYLIGFQLCAVMIEGIYKKTLMTFSNGAFGRTNVRALQSDYHLLSFEEKIRSC